MAQSAPDPLLPGPGISGNKLSPSDRVTETLLNRVAWHTIYDHLTSIVTELKIPEAEFSRIKGDFPLMTREQIFRVYLAWDRRTPICSTKTVIDKVSEWVGRGFISLDVWQDLQPLLSFDLPFEARQSNATSTKTTISATRLKQIQEWTMESLREKPFSTAKGKIWTETPSSIPLEKIFTKLSWVKLHRETYEVEKEDIFDITQLLSEHQLRESSPVRILVEAPGGNGKSTAMKHLALSWADKSVEELQLFDFIFYIPLRAVQDDRGIECIIKEQHSALDGNDVKLEEIEEILSSRTHQNVLLILDGYDEYRPGTNATIDQAITKHQLRNCWMIITSRETTKLAAVRECIDAEAKITGFDFHSVKEYITKYLGVEEKCKDLFTRVNFALLRIPILLHMTCVLFLRKVSLPDTRTGILAAIVERCLDWNEIRETGQKTARDTEEIIVKLGKLAMKGLQRDHLQQTFTKEEIVSSVGKEAFSLGLLTGTEGEESLMFCFYHLLLQEFLAGKFVGTLDKDGLAQLFPMWNDIMKYKETLKFAVGVTENKETLVEFLYTSFIQHAVRQAEIPKYMFDPEISFLSEVLQGVPEIVGNDPRHCKFISYTTEFDTTVNIPTKLYIFGPGVDFGTLQYQVDHDALAANVLPTPAECIAILDDPKLETASKTFCAIAQYQDIVFTYLDTFNGRRGRYDETSLGTFDLKISSNARLIRLDNLTRGTNVHIARQLEGYTLLEILNIFGKVPMDIVSPLGSMKYLRKLTVSGIWDMTEDAYKSMAHNLKNLSKMETLNITGQIDLPAEMGSALSTMSSLKALTLAHCTMEQDVAKGIGQCQPLEKMDLRRSNLMNTLKYLFQNTFPCLKSLFISGTNLSTLDKQNLSQAIQSNIFPVLEVLDVSNNNWRTCVQNLLCGINNSGLPHLKELAMARCNLCYHDITSITECLQRGKLPNLSKLDLKNNSFRECKEEIKELVRHCAEKLSDRELKLDLQYSNLDDEFCVTIRALCTPALSKRHLILYLGGNLEVNIQPGLLP